MGGEGGSSVRLNILELLSYLDTGRVGTEEGLGEWDHSVL